jgi:hypothetical protein
MRYEVISGAKFEGFKRNEYSVLTGHVVPRCLFDWINVLLNTDSE